jgi:catechol 2,3-dioxygenase-like lactoylglutathione lyase family enzyme
MLYGHQMHPTIPASDLARARTWYADKLGLTTDEEQEEALLYRSGEDRLFLLFSSSMRECPDLEKMACHSTRSSWALMDPTPPQKLRKQVLPFFSRLTRSL